MTGKVVCVSSDNVGARFDADVLEEETETDILETSAPLYTLFGLLTKPRPSTLFLPFKSLAFLQPTPESSPLTTTDYCLPTL